MSPPAARATILIAEDSPTQAEALRSLLVASGYGVRVAKSGGAALIELRREPADLVISDVIMPGLSGLDLCRALRADAELREIPFILLTSLAEPLDVVRGLECGADNYVTKPYEPEQLLSRIERTLASRRQSRNGLPGGSIQISFFGSRFVIASSRDQILNVLVSSFEDVARANTALRAAEEEREQLYEQERLARAAAEEANKAKSEFLAMMSHDLRTPLNAIGGFAELLAMGVRGPVNEAQLSDLERIRRNQRHLLALVNDVLNFARLEAGEIPLSLKPTPLDPILVPLYAVIETQAAKRGITYDYLGCDSEITVIVDSEKLDQILINLLGNALKFTPDGGKIAMRCHRNDTNAIIEVTDTGVGIPEAKLDVIFDPFVQVENNGGKRDGVGLGLAISRKLARAMGGDLTVESVVGKGSTFSVWMPLSAPRDS